MATNYDDTGTKQFDWLTHNGAVSWKWSNNEFVPDGNGKNVFMIGK